MYQQYFKIRFLSLLRNICEIGVFRIIFLLLLFVFLFAIYTKIVPEYFSPVVVFLCIYSIHTYRKDKFFIKLSLEKRSTIIYWLEYTMFSLLFVWVSAYKKYYIDILLITGIILIAPFIFNMKIKTPIISNPLFVKGAYEHQLAYRYNFIFLFICYGLCYAGIYNNNQNITYVFYMFIGILYSYPILKPEPLIYTANYTSVKQFILIKGKQILFNTLLLSTPVFITCALSPAIIIHIIQILFLIILLQYAALGIKYVIKNNFIAELFYLLLLIPLFIISFYMPLVMILFIVVLIYLLYKTTNQLMPLFNYD